MNKQARRNLNQIVKFAVYSMAKRAEGEEAPKEKKQDEATSSSFWSSPTLLAGGVGGLAGAGLGAALPALFMKDKEKAKKWILLSALLGTMVGAAAGVGGYMGYPHLLQAFSGTQAPASPDTPSAG